MKYKYLLFDLDGTLTDSREGITKSVQYALAKLGIEENDLKTLEKFIGPPLFDAFIEYYNFSEDKAELAVKYYRENFRTKGIFQNKVYDGIPELLLSLKNHGFKLILATSKPYEFADKIVRHFDIYKYFDEICGSTFDGTISKKDQVIKYVLDKLNINKDDAIMIGDRKYDIIGAKKNNIASIGVTFGFGSYEELEACGATYICEKVSDIEKVLI